ncbi:MAG: hypothetical protein K9G46_14510 [Flavobacteriales bacterium]|nr:hypothetical protein [Flavobacteriales bacterium]
MKKLLFSNKPISIDFGLLIPLLAFGGIMAYNHGLQSFLGKITVQRSQHMF